MDIEIEELIIEYFEIKLHKTDAILKHSYEKASNFRDSERIAAIKLVKKIKPDINENDYENYRIYIHECENFIKEYCEIELNLMAFEWETIGNIRSIIRDRKLKNLGL